GRPGSVDPADHARRIRRPAAVARQSARLHRRRPEPPRGARSCAVLRPARSRQDDAGADRRPRIGGRLPRHLGSRHPARRRPRRERFGIPLRLLFYEAAELAEILARGAGILALDLTADGAAEIARRARGTPRIAMRLLRRIRDFAAVHGWGSVDAATADKALLRLEVDHRGLDAMDRRYLRAIAEHYGGGPVGVETMAAALGDQRDVL